QGADAVGELVHLTDRGHDRQRHQVPDAADRLQAAHFAHPAQRLDHGRHLLGQHRDHDQCPDPLAAEIVADAYRVPGDHPHLLEPLDPALHRGPRQLQLARDLGGGGPRILAQQGQQGLIGAGQGHGATPVGGVFRRFAEIYMNSAQFAPVNRRKLPDNRWDSPLEDRPCRCSISSPRSAPTRARAAPPDSTTPPCCASPPATPNWLPRSRLRPPSTPASATTLPTCSTSTRTRSCRRCRPASSISTSRTRSTRTSPWLRAGRGSSPSRARCCTTPAATACSASATPRRTSSMRWPSRRRWPTS